MADVDVLALTAESFSSVAGGVGDIVTIIAVAVGGYWAYFNFIKGRTYEPRLSVHLSAQWHLLADQTHAIQIRVRVTNIGASKVSLLQRGTAMLLAFPAAEQTHEFDEAVWTYVPLDSTEGFHAFEILTEHRWIEPNETVSDDILITPGCVPTVALIEASLIWTPGKWRDQTTETESQKDDVAVFERAIVAPDGKVADSD